MSYAPIRRGRKSLKDTMRDGIAGQRMYAAAMDEGPRKDAALARLDAQAAAIPPKRHKIRRPVDGKPPHASEHQEQVAVIQWWGHACGKYNLPEFALFAIPNGGARDMITGARLKAEGVRGGVLDLALPVPRGIYHGAFIEMKVGYNKPSDKQDAFIEFLRASGYHASVHWSSTSAIAEIEGYLNQ